MTNKLFTDLDDPTELEDGELQIEIPDDNPFANIVGDDKLYRTQQDVAKALIEKENFIRKLKNDNAVLRSEVSTRSRVEEAIDKMLKTNTNPASNPVTPPGNGTNAANGDDGSNTNKGFSEADVLALLEKREKERAYSANAEQAKKALVEKYGADASRVLKQRATELGTTEEALSGLARTTPSAFLALFPDVVKKPEPGIPATSVNQTARPVSANPRNKKYYDDILKKDPKAYLSRDTQLQMHRDAIELKEAFYS